VRVARSYDGDGARYGVLRMARVVAYDAHFGCACRHGREGNVEGTSVRHISVGQPCPVDSTPTSRAWCSGCPEFVSYRSRDGVATVGCRSGEDVAGWLRREMSHPDIAPWLRRQMAGRSGSTTTPSTRAMLPVRSRPMLGGSVGVFLAAVGVGLLLSALERD
jgi:hypothetical protein